MSNGTKTRGKKFSDLSLLNAYDRMKEIIRLYVDPAKVRSEHRNDVEEIFYHD